MAQNLYSMPGLTWNTPAPKGTVATFGTAQPVNMTQAYASGGLQPLQQTQGSGQVLGAGTQAGGKNLPQNTNRAGAPLTSTPVSSPPVPQGPSNEEIDSLYNPSLNYLNSAESALRSDYDNVLTQADRDFQTLSSQLTANKQSNLATIDESGVRAGQVKDDALSAARRLYDELRRGYQQRFGGATSAGQAASEISSVEQQRQMGLTGRQYNDTMREIDLQRQKTESDYQTGIIRLEENKRTAITQATSDFQNKLLEIANNRSQIGQAKAQARLDALQQLRNQVFNIQQQTYQFQQALEAQKQQSTADLSAYMQKLSSYAGASTSALANSGMNTNPTSSLQVGGMGGPQSAQMVGRIGNTQYKVDEYGNPIFP